VSETVVEREPSAEILSVPRLAEGEPKDLDFA
jgi:hypothetical protein